MDETPIYFEMFSKTSVAKIGERSVNVKTFGSDRNRISLILCISANGLKLPPLIIFKGQLNGRIESLLSKNNYVKNKKIYALCQPISWADKNIFLFWLQNVFFNNKHISNDIKKILILDRVTSHYDDDLVNIFKKNNSKYILIPPRLTRYLQPLDVSINKPFKQYMHHFDIDFRIKNQNTKKPSYNDIIEAVVNIWYDEKIITQNEIIKSFKVTGISNKLDGSENNMFIKHEILY